jgi:hypothetical protein
LRDARRPVCALECEEWRPELFRSGLEENLSYHCDYVVACVGFSSKSGLYMRGSKVREPEIDPANVGMLG